MIDRKWSCSELKKNKGGGFEYTFSLDDSDSEMKCTSFRKEKEVRASIEKALNRLNDRSLTTREKVKEGSATRGLKMEENIRNMSDSELVRASEDSDSYLAAELGRRLMENHELERISRTVDEIGVVLKKSPQTKFVLEAIELVEKIQDGDA